MNAGGWGLLWTLACTVAVVGTATSDEIAGRVPEGWFFTLPGVDAIQGGLVFSKRECYNCHKVAGRSFRRLDAGGVGPDFGPGYGGMPAAYLAESILNPHKVIAGQKHRYRAEDGRSSRMRDNSELTLRELVDVVAYLRSLR